MVKALIDLSHVYKDLIKEKGIDINWKAVDGSTNPMTFVKEFGYKINKFQYPEKITDLESYFSLMDCTEDLTKLKIPTMMVSAKNDPIHSPKDMPWEQIESNENIIYVYTPRGAHLEFMVGIQRNRWYKPVMTKFLNYVDDMRDDNLLVE